MNAALWRRIRVVAFDVDGTLTDGSIYLGADGEALKRFCARDGMGMVLARRAGLVVGLISGRASAITRRRAAELELDFCYDGAHDKVAVLEAELTSRGYTWKDAAFMGDDINDVPVLQRVALAAVPADADVSAAAVAQYRSRCNGGRGAAREWLDRWLSYHDGAPQGDGQRGGV